MYKRFFNLRQRPFQLVPDPDYLFLSLCHEEALAHLTYALDSGEGFVEITGEVGTGKTTLCRAFLEQLDDTVEAAYIFNPRLSEIELLKSINDEFGIDSGSDSLKELTDTLNRFLIKKRSQGKKAVIVIDEAQNLDVEVLEQLRLLSNLETTTEKLLQIVLTGQPELSDLLNRYELRQLSQRIAITANLTPLSHEETYRYINHRLSIASDLLTVTFTRRALKTVYDYSKGTPRNINVICNKALIEAYAAGEKRITKQIVQRVVRQERVTGNQQNDFERILLVLFVIFGVLAGFYVIQWTKNQGTIVTERDETGIQKESAVPKRADPAQGRSNQGEETTQKSSPVQKVWLQRRQAAAAAIRLWGDLPDLPSSLDAIRQQEVFFKQAARHNGFSLYKPDDFERLQTIDLPAIIEVRLPESRKVAYGMITGMDGSASIIMGDEERRQEKAVKSIQEIMTGTIYVFWKNFSGINGVIPGDTDQNSIIALKILMQAIGFKEIEISSRYDDWTRENVRFFQGEMGMEVDGIVGPLTKIMLYNAKSGLIIPHLNSKRSQVR